MAPTVYYWIFRMFVAFTYKGLLTLCCTYVMLDLYAATIVATKPASFWNVHSIRPSQPNSVCAAVFLCLLCCFSLTVLHLLHYWASVFNVFWHSPPDSLQLMFTGFLHQVSCVTEMSTTSVKCSDECSEHSVCLPSYSCTWILKPPLL